MAAPLGLLRAFLAFSVPSQTSPWGGRSSDPCFPGRPGGSVLGSAFPAQRRPREERVLLGEPIHPRPPLHGRDWGVRHGDQVTGETSRSSRAAGRRQDMSCVPLSPGCPACARTPVRHC